MYSISLNFYALVLLSPMTSYCNAGIAFGSKGDAIIAAGSCSEYCPNFLEHLFNFDWVLL